MCFRAHAARLISALFSFRNLLAKKFVCTDPDDLAPTNGLTRGMPDLNSSEDRIDALITYLLDCKRLSPRTAHAEWSVRARAPIRGAIEMQFLATLVILGLALAAGLIANRWVGTAARTDAQGVKLEHIVSPLMTLTVLLLSFVLVQAYSSYNGVRAAEAKEASQLAFQFETAGYFADDVAVPMQAALVCYGRSVAEVEWSSLAGGSEFHPLPTQWADQVQDGLSEISDRGDTDQPYGRLVESEQSRGEVRGQRVAAADPSVPSIVEFLMILISAVALIALAMFALPSISRGAKIGSLVALTIVLVAVHWTIYEVDHQYDGIVQIEPRQLALVTTEIADEFVEQNPDVALPCDERGIPG